MLSVSNYLEPITVFLYTWQFLQTLEAEEISTRMKKVYRWYKLITIWLVPAVFLGLYIAVVLTFTETYVCFFDSKCTNYEFWQRLMDAILNHKIDF